MDNAAGEDLSWFWHEWFFTTWKLDQAVKQIDYVDGDPTKGSLITIENLQGLAMPVTVFLKQDNGDTSTVKLPAEIWERGGTWTFAYKSTSKIAYAIIDPDHRLPDINPDNNGYSGISMDKSVTAATVLKTYLDAVGGEEKLKDIKDLTVTSEGNVQGIVVQRLNEYKNPDKFYQDINVPAYQMNFYHVVINSDSVNVKDRGRPMVIAPTERGPVRARYKLFPELDFQKTGYSMALAPSFKVVNGQLAYELTVTSPDGVKVNYFYDMKTGLKVKQFTDVPNATVMEWSDYQSIETGIKIPFDEKTAILGQPIEFKVKSTKVNTGLSNDVFK